LGGASKPINNPLSHLTDKAIGFNDTQSQDNQLVGLHPLTNESNTEGTLNNSFSNDHIDNIENQAQNKVSFPKRNLFYEINFMVNGLDIDTSS
jgi:hypothetical protein